MRTRKVTFFVQSVPITNALKILEATIGVPVVFVTKQGQGRIVPPVTLRVKRMTARNAFDWLETLTMGTFTVEDGRVLYHNLGMQKRPGPWIAVEPPMRPLRMWDAALCWVQLPMRSFLDDITRRTGVRFVVRPQAEEKVRTSIISAALPKWWFDRADFSRDLEEEKRALDKKDSELNKRLDALTDLDEIKKVQKDIKLVKRKLDDVRMRKLARRELGNPMDKIAKLVGLKAKCDLKAKTFTLSVRKPEKPKETKEQ